MIEPQSHSKLRQEIIERTKADRELLDRLRQEIRPLKSQVRRIQPRTTTAVSLVATDGGNNRIQFDPFLIQLVRVVDSSNNELCLEAISPTTNTDQLSKNQFDASGGPITALGEMMLRLGVSHLNELSPMIPRSDGNSPVNPSWVQVYRELVEWAVLLKLVTKDYGTDTLMIFDGLFRSKVFSGTLFHKYREQIHQAIQEQKQKNRRSIYLAGVAKHSKVLDRYRLAMALEGILTTNFPAYVEVPRDIEGRAYAWDEYAKREDKFVSGKMFFVKFGAGPRDPIWPIDVFLPQISEAQAIIGCMLSDAINGFPVPYYPMCLQKAHENAALVDFDFDILQEQVFEGIRVILEDESTTLDVFRLQDADPASQRYD